MTAFNWFKVNPGLYDLYRGPKANRDRVASLAKKGPTDGAHIYKASLLIAPFNYNEVKGRYQTAMSEVEGWVKAQIPGASFGQENFR